MNHSTRRFSHRESIRVTGRPEVLYDVISDVTRTAARIEQAHTGIPQTLAAIKRIVE